MTAAALVRRPNWPELLHAYIESRRFMPFEWGHNDCGLFAADAIIAITGTDLAADLRGYKSGRGAASRIAKAGGMRGLAGSLIEKKHGFASRGDLVLVELDARETFGVVAGNGFWCGPGENGLVFRPMSEVVTAFGF